MLQKGSRLPKECRRRLLQELYSIIPLLYRKQLLRRRRRPLQPTWSWVRLPTPLSTLLFHINARSPYHSIPDVSAVGDNIATFFEGRLSRSGGTSASTPVFASLVNRINEQRLNAGKSTLGFMNPALYLHPEILNDITNGTNPGCGTVGFSAVPGWDPVTGLGEC